LAAHSTTREESARTLAEKEASWAARQGELEAQIADLRAHLAAAEEVAAQKTRELEVRDGELDRLRAVLADEQAKLDHDFVKWGETTISLEKARGALGSVLSRAQGVFGKKR